MRKHEEGVACVQYPAKDLTYNAKYTRKKKTEISVSQLWTDAFQISFPLKVIEQS